MDKQKAPDEITKLNVFISHAGEDLKIAQALQKAIQSLYETNIDVFLDDNSIAQGGPISETIKDFLGKSDFFIGIATQNLRNQFSWCGLELGYFSASGPENRRINYLYHDEIQDVFKQYRGTKIEAIDSTQSAVLSTTSNVVTEAPIYKLLIQIGVEASRRNFPNEPFEFFDSLRKAAEAGALQVTNAYAEQLVRNAKQVRYPQGRIKVSFPPGLNHDELRQGIRKAKVSIYPKVAYLFEMPTESDAMPTQMEWQPFSEKMQKISSGPSYLPSIIYEIIDDFLPKEFDAKNDYLFQTSEDQAFRVILVRYEKFGDGRSEFIFNLIETLAPLAGGDPKTTLITSAIVLATQFRSLFIEHDATYSVGKLQGLQEDQLVSTIKDILRDVRRIHIESATHGLTQDAVKAALGSPRKIDAWNAQWWPLVTKLEDEAHAYIAARTEPNKKAFLSAHEDMVEKTSLANREFTSLCLQVYKQIIDKSA